MSDSTNGGPAFDPTSSSSMTAWAMTIIGLVCAGGAAYSMGKNTKDKEKNWWFRSAMFVVVSGIFLYAAGVYIWFSYN